MDGNVLISDDITSMNERQSLDFEADESQRCETDQNIIPYNEIFETHSISKEDLLELVQDSQRQLAALASEIQSRDEQVRAITRQLEHTQELLSNASKERDDLILKNITVSSHLVENPPEINSCTDGISRNKISECSTVAINQDNSANEIQLQHKKVGRKKRCTKSLASMGPGFRFLIPRPTIEEGNDVIDVRIAACSNGGQEISDKIIKLGIGNILLGGINEPPQCRDMKQAKVVTVYNVVEGLKEFEAVIDANDERVCHVTGCAIQFESDKELEIHYKQIHDFGTIIALNAKRKKHCDQCSKIFLNASDLSLHKKWHHPVPVDEDAKRAALINIAAWDGDGNLMNPCVGNPPKSSSLCIDIVNDTPMNVSSHSSVAIVRKYQCYYCSSKYAIKDFCEAHIRQKHFKIDRPFLCKTCNRSLTSRRAYQTHIEIHKTNRGSNHSCNICGRHFMSINNLRRHAVLHTNIRPHLCSICGISFTQKSSLDHHMRVHGVLDTMQCPFCCRGYRAMGKLKEHIETKHNGTAECYRCCICEIEASDETSLKEHFETHKTVNREKPFGCNICSFSTFFPRDLHCHLEAHKRGVARLEKRRGTRSHTCNTVGPFICKYCGKKCIGRDYLDLHEVKHTGEKKFECDICKRRFTMLPLLRRHIESKHKGVRYPCKICGKQFTEPGNIKRHIADVHHRMRPYQCDLCQKSFSQKVSLAIHYGTTAHSEKFKKILSTPVQPTDPSLGFQTVAVQGEDAASSAMINQLVFTNGINHIVLQPGLTFVDKNDDSTFDIIEVTSDTA